MKKSFRDALLDAIKATNTPLKQVAEGAGVSYEQLKSFAQGKSRSTNVDDAVKLADFLGTTVDDLVSGHFAPAPPPPQGFSDGPVAPFAAPPRMTDLAYSIARLRSTVDHPSLWTLKAASPGLSLLADDILVIDMRMNTPAAGSIVIVQIIDPETGEAETRLRRYMPPYLTDGTAGDLTQIDPDHTTIMGTVRATLRLPR